MAEKQPRLVRFWPCVCWGSQLLDPTGEQSELITRVSLSVFFILKSYNTGQYHNLLLHSFPPED